MKTLYRNTESTAPTRGWTVKRLDKSGRVCVEEYFAGASNPTVATNCTPSSGTTGATIYSYNAALNYTLQTITDPAGKRRDLYQDALGRLIAVREDPVTAKYDTYYEYDLLDNLTFTRQTGSCSGLNPVASPCGGGQTRSFAYDSLKRLSTATNPELGGNSIGYWYDDNGNLTSKLSSGSPSLLMNYTYDLLNRVQTRDYSDGTTPLVTYCYDGTTWNGSIGGCIGTPSAPSKQRLTEVSSTISRMSYEYNVAGQVTSSMQTTAGKSFPFGYTYTAAMTLASEIYPTGRIVTKAYDDAGRTKYVTGQNGSVVTDYAGNLNSPIQYASHGAIRSIPMGNGIVETRTYNSRLQPAVIQAGSLLTILNCYQTSDDPTYCGSLPVTANNGNVQRQRITRGGQYWVQNYTYDAVNRLGTATETSAWSQTYGYDAFGNRWLSASSGVPVSPLTPMSSTSFDAYTNRLSGAYTYDPRGNLTSYGSYTLTYDGEDRVMAASGIAPSTKYEYDGEGRRVRAHSCSGASTCVPGSGANTTIYVYDAFGKLAMEYQTDTAPSGTTYYTQDHLGSTRLETDALGLQVKCSDYLPFGEEIPAGYGNRSSCFAANDNKIKFTSKERDSETGLDYFGARYYSGAQGRFTSPDPKAASARLEDPQSWNRYAYTRNNPLKYVDPDGKDFKLVYNPKTNTATITINIVLTGPGASKQLAADWQKDTSAKIGGKHQTGFGMTLDVKVNVTTDPNSVPALGRNQMDVDSAHQKTEVTPSADGKHANQGFGTPADLAEQNVRTHETLHFGGLADQYDPGTNAPLPDHEGTIMGDPRNPNSEFMQQEIDQMGRNACNYNASCSNRNPEPKKP